MSERVSRLLDGQLERDAVADAVAGIFGNADERDRLTLYTLIGDSLRRNSTPDDGFTNRLLRRLDSVSIEPGYDPLKD